MIKKLIFLLCVIMVSFNNNLFSQAENEQEVVEQEPAQLADEQIEQLEYYKSQALKALNRGEYPYCAAMFEKYLAVKDDDFKVNEYLSQVYIFMEKYAEAALILKKMIELRPEYVNGYVNLGRLYRELGFFEESVASLEKALDLKKNVEILFQLGLTYERFNKLDKARSIYEEVIYILPVHAEAHFSLGLLYLRERDYDRAKREIKRAVDLNPDRQIYQTYFNKIDEYRASELDNEHIQIEDNPILFNAN